jgi:hypothetical protein
MSGIAAHRADFLASCQATQQGSPVLEEIRNRGAEVVLALFRLTKNSLVHARDNQALIKTIDQTRRIVTDFGATVGGMVSVTFIDQNIFVCGQLMRASRSIYESGTELGQLLERCGISEISISSEATPQDLASFAEAFSISARDPKQRGRLLQTKFDNLAVRKVDTTLVNRQENRELPDLEQALLVYASALIVIRDFFDRIANGKPVMLARLKRVAQRLVTLADRPSGSMLALTTLVHAHRDDAGRALQSAILAILVARQLNENRSVLGQLALSALLSEGGRIRIAGATARDRLVRLSDEAEQAVPAATSAICIVTGGVNLKSAYRTVTAYETTYAEREPLLGPLYKRTLSPLIASKILRVTRGLLDLLAPRDTSRSLSVLDALAQLSQMPTIDKVVYRLLVLVVGLMPTGTVVEFETGEWGVVTGPSANKSAIGSPRIKLLTDRHGQVFAQPKEIDLGAQDAKRFPPITGIIEPERARFGVTTLISR